MDVDVALDALRPHDEPCAPRPSVRKPIPGSHPGALPCGVHRDQGRIWVRVAGDDTDGPSVQRRVGRLLAGGEESVGVEVEPRGVSGNDIVLGGRTRPKIRTRLRRTSVRGCPRSRWSGASSWRSPGNPFWGPRFAGGACPRGLPFAPGGALCAPPPSLLPVAASPTGLCGGRARPPRAPFLASIRVGQTAWLQ